jgi:pimeloyl-ACP methyl ester carboxylesterase
MLGTNIASRVIMGDIPLVGQSLAAVPTGSIAVSVVTEADLDQPQVRQAPGLIRRSGLVCSNDLFAHEPGMRGGVRNTALSRGRQAAGARPGQGALMAGMTLRRTAAILIGLVAAGSLLAVGVSYRREIGQARARVSVGSQVVETRCGPIEYAVAGDGPPVLVVHGAGGGFDQGIDFLEPLARNGLRIIAMSRFGYLRTPLPQDASAAAQADAHACLLDALNIPRAAILGASAGAPSSMQFALRHPERTTALVLLVPAAYVPRPGGAPPMVAPRETEFLFEIALRSDFLFWLAPRIARETVMRAILATPPAVVAAAAADEQARAAGVIARILPVSPRRPGLLNDAAVTSTLPRYELERIAAPTLVLSMEDDLFGTYDVARYSAEHIPNARFVGYPSGGHLWVGHQAEVMDEIAGFLRTHAAGPDER